MGLRLTGYQGHFHTVTATIKVLFADLAILAPLSSPSSYAMTKEKAAMVELICLVVLGA